MHAWKRSLCVVWRSQDDEPWECRRYDAVLPGASTDCSLPSSCSRARLCLAMSLGSASHLFTFHGKAPQFFKAIPLSMPLPAIYSRWVHMAMKDLELSWSLLCLLRTRVSKDIPFFFFFKDPFSAIHKSQVALRLPFQIIAFLKLHERIQYIHLLGQVPATCSKLIWFCFLPDLQWSVKEGINYGGSSILNYIILIFFFFCRMGHHIITNSYRVCMQFKFPK